MIKRLLPWLILAFLTGILYATPAPAVTDRADTKPSEGPTSLNRAGFRQTLSGMPLANGRFDAIC